MFATALLAIALLANTAGQLLFKAASVKAAGEGIAAHWLALGVSPYLWTGIATYVVEFFMWLAFISLVPLWQGVMVASVDILLVTLGGAILFGERLTPPRVAAISLIAVGVLLVGWGGQ